MKMKRRDPGCWLMMTTPPQNQNFSLKTEESNQTVNKATHTHNQNPNAIMHFSLRTEPVIFGRGPGPHCQLKSSRLRRFSKDKSFPLSKLLRFSRRRQLTLAG